MNHGMSLAAGTSTQSGKIPLGQDDMATNLDFMETAEQGLRNVSK